jgi:segregation and condensation protein A
VINDKLDLNGISISDLVEYLKTLYRFEEEASPITTVVTIPRVTIKNKIHELIQHLRKDTHLTYKKLLPKGYNRLDAIVLFLAILELVKQQYVIAEQEGLFSDIGISATEQTYIDKEIKLALDD